MNPRAFVIGALCVLGVASIGIMVLTLTLGDFAVADEKKEELVYTEGKDSDGKVITTKSGLKYVEMKEGTGDAAKEGSKVKVHYTGTLENGKKFDSSLDRNEPFEVTIGRTSVIKGWTEGLQGMKAGGKRKLIIPPELGYGDRGAGSAIPPKATLIFVIEMLEVK